MTASGKPVFHLPSPEDWKTLVRDLGLEERQAQELKILLQHVEADLEAYAHLSPTREERRELVGALKAFSKALDELETVVKDRLPELSEALPHASAGAIGDMLTVTEIERALGKTMTMPGLDSAVGREVENATAYARQAQGIAAGPELLSHVLRRIHQPVEVWLEDSRANRGGRPPDHIRNYVILKLAEGAEDIIGQPATSNGPFLKLCAEVVGHCRLETVGLRDAVERALGVREL